MVLWLDPWYSSHLWPISLKSRSLIAFWIINFLKNKTPVMPIRSSVKHCATSCFRNRCLKSVWGHDGEHHQCVNLRDPDKSRRTPGIQIDRSPKPAGVAVVRVMCGPTGFGAEWRHGYVWLIPSWSTQNHRSSVNRLCSNTKCSWR